MLKTYREQLDKIDTQIIELLNQRFEICQLIGEYKKRNNLSIYDAKREKQMFLRLSQLEKYPNMVNFIFPYITKYSRSLQ